MTNRAIGTDELRATGAWIASHQRGDGAIPWVRWGKVDPWDHVQCAMALAATDRIPEAREALRFLARTQGADGAWPAGTTAERILDPTRETNHAAYLATGLWFLQQRQPDLDFLVELWPTVDRGISFSHRLQAPSGAIWWATDAEGAVWRAPLLTGSSSIYGSLVCAIRIAHELGIDRPAWERARDRLGRAIRDEHPDFARAELPEAPGRHAMDWYYPVLGGAVRGESARRRLLTTGSEFLRDGIGCRCVADRPWYTVAETCELVLALEACDLAHEAEPLIEWVHELRDPDGGYWTGIAYPEQVRWPTERSTWSAATVILAVEALAGESETATFFRELGEPEVVADELARAAGRSR